MITVKDNLHYGRKSTKLTFEMDINRDFFKSSYDDTIVRCVVERQLIRLLQRDLDNMYNEYNSIKFKDKED